jgi:HAD superfamily hydrolase (TIGR01509 family)
MAIRGAIFDLDGTLVDSGLDFDLIRSEMGIAKQLPILEALAEPHPDNERRWSILAEHELRGVERAQLFPGVREFLDELARREILRAVLTRNSRISARAVLGRFDIDVHALHARDDGPVKPDPAGIWRICEKWGFQPSECVMIGDYRYDIEAGRSAGSHTVLFTGGRKHSVLAEHEQADFTLTGFTDSSPFFSWLATRSDP